MQPRTLSLNTAIKNIQKMMQRLVGEDVDVRLMLCREDPLVHADPSQIEQVIMNLAVNARDAMPRGGSLLIETSIVGWDESTARQNPDITPGEYALMAISDTGIGMDEPTTKRIFEPFFTTKPVGEGTGLGLSMVHGIVVQSGGHVRVCSELGHGTTFRIYFPSATRKPEEAAESAPAFSRALRGKETILIVEDQADVRNFVVAVLKACCYRVIEAPTASEALIVVEREGDQIDLVLTDVVMPKMSGPQLVERIVKARPAIKVLFMSGYTDNVIVQHGILDEGINLIQKPFGPDELAAKVRVVLGASPPIDRAITS